MEDNKKQYYVQFEGAKQGVVIDADKYEANKDRLYKEHPNATVIETFDYDGNDEGLDPSTSSFVVQFEGASQAVNVPFEAFQQRKEQFYQEHPNARVSISKNVSDEYWGGKAQESRAALDEFNADENRGGFMRNYEAEAEKQKTQAVSGSVARNAQSADNSLNDYIKQNYQQYQALVSEKKALEDEYFMNPLVQKEIGARADYATHQKDEYLRLRDNATTGAEKRDYRRAAELQRDIKDMYSAASRYGEKNGFAEYLKGMGDTFSDQDFWSRGITEAARNIDIRGIQKKIQDAGTKMPDLTPEKLDELLSPSEKALLTSFIEHTVAQADTAGGISHGYNAGLSAAESLGFMAEFFLTGAIGKGVGAALGKSNVAIAQWIGKALQGNGALAEGVKSEVGRIALTTLAEPVAQAVWHTGAQLPSTVKSITDNLTQVKDNGELITVGEAIRTGVLDSLIENWSESMGGSVESVLAAPFKGAAWLGQKTVGQTGFGRWARWLNDAKGSQILKQAGFNGFIGEMGEEWLGNAARVGVGIMDKQEFRQWGGDIFAGRKSYADDTQRKEARRNAWESQAEMAASFALMSSIGLATSTYGAVKQAKQYRAALPKEREILARAGATDDQINEIFDTKYDTTEDIAKKFAPWLKKIAENKDSNDSALEDYRETLNFIKLSGQEQIMSAFADYEKEAERSNADAEVSEMLGNTGYTHVVPADDLGNAGVRYITTEDGRRAFIQSTSGSTHAVRYTDGTTGFLTDEQIAQGVADGTMQDSGEMSREQFLDSYIAEKKSGAEQQRMQTELEQKVYDVRNTAVPGTQINIGTVESPVIGTIMQWTADGCVIQSPDGSFVPMTVDEVGAAIKMPTTVLSDAEIQEKEADKSIRRGEMTRKLNEASGLPFTFNGKDYVLSSVYDIEENENGEEVAIVIPETEDMELEVPVSVLQQSLDAYSPAAAEAELEETEAAQTEQAQKAQEEDNVPRDFRGNPLPLKADGKVNQKILWNNDPEAWAEWNNTNPNSAVNTMDYLNGRIAGLEGDIKKLQKAIEKETKSTGDFDKIEEYSNQISDLRQRQALVQGVADKFTKREQLALETEKENERRRVAELNEPQNITQLAAQVLKNVKAHSLNRDDFKRELGWGNTELARFFPWWAKKGKGLTVTDLAESMAEQDAQYGFVPMDANAEQKDTQAARNAIIDVLQSLTRPGELTNYVMNENQAIVEAQKDQSEAEAEREVMARYGLTLDEYNAMSEEEKAKLEENNVETVDNQGNLVDANGRLIVEKVNSIDELTDEDFMSASRSVELPAIPEKVASAIGSNKPVIIKKNVFEKNAKAHKDLSPADGRKILTEVLYSPDLYGQNQKATRPFNWILIHLADKNEAVILEVNNSKENTEIVNWHYLRDASLEQKKKQAIKEGGLILTLSNENAAGNAVDDLLSKQSSVTTLTPNQTPVGGEAGAVASETVVSESKDSENSEIPTVTEDISSAPVTENVESQEAEPVVKESLTTENAPIGTIETGSHEKTGQKQWIVKPSDRVSDEEFAVLKKRAKENGGFWYGKKKGFIFYDEESANNFNNSNPISNAEETDIKTASDTAAIVSEAESVAEKAQSLAESLEPADAEVSAVTEQIDSALHAIDEQLAILGYYSADTDSKYDEQYGYGKSAQRKAQKDIDKLAKSLAADLGIKVGRGMIAKANIAPAGGEVYFRLPLMDGRELYLDVRMQPDYDTDDLRASSLMNGGANLAIMWRIENPSGADKYGINNFEKANVPYLELLQNIRNAAKDYLPVQPSDEDILQSAEKVSRANRKKAENSLPLNGDEILGGLFDTLVDEQAAAEEESEPAPEPAKPQKPTEINGYKVGDKVLYSYPGREPAEVKIVDFEDGRPVLDSFSASWITELADWEYISRIEEPQTSEENGLQRNDAVRSEGLPADDSGSVSDNRGRGEETGGEAGQESGGSDTGRAESGDEQRRNLRPRPASSVKRNTHNNRAERGTDYAPTTPKARFNANIDAIKLMKQLVANEKKASKEDMAVLRQFSGWGGLGTFFNNEYSPEYKQLKNIMTDDEFQDASMSINSAYFTPASVIDGLWDIAKRLGFEGGTVLEGSAGIGNILGLMPKQMSEASDISAVEIDSTTGNILKLLYPDATVHIKGFQDVKIPNNSVDLAITNVPFVTGLHVYDSAEKDLSSKFENIHDFCIAKNVRKLKEGGLGIFITTSGTLDKSHKLRKWVVNEGGSDFIGAFRLNNDTFGGTNATSDILVIRKRVNAVKSAEAIDVSETSIVRTGEYDGETTWDSRKREYVTETNRVAMEYNSYFVENPQFMAGEMKFGYEKGDTSYRPGSVGLYPKEGLDQNKALNKWVKTLKNTGEAARSEVVPTQVSTAQETTLKEGQILVNDKGEVCVSRGGKAIPAGVDKNKVKGFTKAQCVKDYDALKNAVNDVISFEQSNADDKGLANMLARLNNAYDQFVKRYGSLNKNTSISFIRNNDVDFASVAALEDYKETEDINGKKKVDVEKTDIFKKRIIGYRTETSPQTSMDGVIVSVQQFGRINLPYIAEKLGRSEESIGQEILDQGLAFMDPASGQYVTSYEYLSGNVRSKLEYATEQNEDGRYDRNIEALKKVVPFDIPAHQIEFSLGSDWIAPKQYEDFAKDKFGIGDDFKLAYYGGNWHETTNIWGRTEKNCSAGVTSNIIGKTVLGHELMVAAMNNKSVDFSKKTDEGYIYDKVAQQAAQTRMDEMRDEFVEWLRGKFNEDNELRDTIQKRYNDTFNNYVPEQISDEYLQEHLDGANTDLTLYPHQKKAVIRGTTEPLMLAHEVGSGKTFTLISTAMEMRRLGTAKKPMIVVQNSTVGQFVSEAKRLYPAAKVLTVTEADRTREGRAAFYAKIKYNDWDLIIVPQSVFEMIPDSEERKRAFIQEKIDEKQAVLAMAQEAKADSRAISQIKDEIKALEYEREFGEPMPKKNSKKNAKKEAEAVANTTAKTQKQMDRRTDETSDFDDMGIDALLVDEAHTYKKLGFATNIKRGVKGVDASGSKRSAGLYLKTRSIFDRVGWKNVVFATGTPISNTAAEIWTFMKYLMPADVMKSYHIYYFDDFVKNFGKIATSLEFATNGKFKENTRFSSYGNVPELVRIWSSVCDTVLTKDAAAAKSKDGKPGKLSDKLPKMTGASAERPDGKPEEIFLPQSMELRGVMKWVRDQLDDFEKMSGEEKKENSSIPLVMYGIAKRAAIDTRLVLDDGADDPNSKTNKAVSIILDDLKQTEGYKGTVAVFCDSYRRLDVNPKTGNKDLEGFNIFDDIKNKLVAAGVPENQIAVVRSGKGKLSDKAKEKLFQQVNDGEVRVIMGSTQTLGTGVNIQQRLHAAIHMDTPDRPMDVTQRNGRILRQGNLHKEWDLPVRVIRMGVEDSLDVTGYQRLDTKSKFINSIMNGKQYIQNASSVEFRTLEEEEDDMYSNPVAVLSGSQYALLKSKAERDLRKYNTKLQQYKQDQIYINHRLGYNQRLIKDKQDRIEKYKGVLDEIKTKFPDGKVTSISVNGVSGTGNERIQEIIKEKISAPLRTMADQGRVNSYFTDVDKTYDVKINGIDVPVRVRLEREYKYDYENQRGGYVMHTRYFVNNSELDIHDRLIAASPLEFRSMNAIVDYFNEQIATGLKYTDGIKADEKRIAELERDNAETKKREGKPFADSDKLDEAKRMVDEYTKLMQEEMTEKEKKYAEMDAPEVNISISSARQDEEEEATEEAETYNRDADETEQTLDNNNPEVIAKVKDALNPLIERLGVPVRYVRGSDNKGHYTVGNNEVVINIGAHSSIEDVVETYLHEAVAHYGLRRLMGEQFKDFIDSVWNNASEGLRRRIRTIMGEKGYDRRTAVEEYIAELAQKTDYNRSERNLWRKIVDAIRNFVDSIVGRHGVVTDSTIRDILTTSYHNLEDNAEQGFSPEEIAQMETPVLSSKGTFDNLAEAEKWAKVNLQGESFVNKFSGSRIAIGKKSIDEMLSPKSSKAISESLHMKALMSVPEFIESGIPAEIHKDTHGRGFDVMRLYSAIEIDGETYRVKSTVKRVAQGDRYYTYELQEMEMIEGAEISVGSPRGTNLIPQSSSIKSITGAKLLKGVKKTNSDEEIIRYRRGYHGSGANFDRFDLSHIGEGEGAMVHGYGTYVAFNKDIAMQYAMALSPYRTEYHGQEIADTSSKMNVLDDVLDRMDKGGQTELVLRNKISELEQKIKQNPDAMTENALEYARGLKYRDFRRVWDNRNLYAIEIPDDMGDNYLDERKIRDRKEIAPLLGKIENALLAEGFDLDDKGIYLKSWNDTKRDLAVGHVSDKYTYDSVAMLFQGVKEMSPVESKKAASELFNSLGYVGIKYDGMKDGECAVIFNDEDLIIVDHTLFRKREKPAPKKTGIGYKVFFRKNGKLYPPMVANPNGEDTPVGVWLDADAAPVAGQSKSGRPQVKAGGKGTQGGSGQLAYRPGWHLGEIPYALQFNRKDENGEKTLFPKDFVWAEVEYAADVDYQKEADAEGMTENGKYRHSYAGLKRLPEDGFYRYRTNPNPETDPWIITGAMKVNKVLTDEEVDELVRKAGREPQRREGSVVRDRNVNFDRRDRQPGEGAMDFVRRAIKAMESNYKKIAKNPNFYYDINPESGIVGGYNKEKDYIAYYAAEGATRFAEVEDTFFHENIHSYLNKFDSDGFIGRVIDKAREVELYDSLDKEWELIKKHPEYEGEEKNEFSTRILTFALTNGTVRWFRTQFEADDRAIFTDLFNAFGYDAREEEQRRHFGRGTFGTDFGRSEESNVGVGEDVAGGALRGATRSDSGEERDRSRTDSFGVTASLPARQEAARRTAETLGAEVEIVERQNMPSGHEFSQGVWVDGKIFICPENCADADDAARTVIHEAVGHEGLRKLVGNERMSSFCMELYRNATPEIRQEIVALADKHGYHIAEAVEEYLAYLSETTEFSEPQRTFWEKVVDAVRELLSNLGINLPIYQRDIKWILWQSYNATRNGYVETEIARARLAHRLGFSMAADRIRHEGQNLVRDRKVAEEKVDSAADIYNMSVSTLRARLHEIYVDQYDSVNRLVEAVEKSSGKAAKSYEDIRKALNQYSSKALETGLKWHRNFFAPMLDAVNECMELAECKESDIVRYVFLKHGLERNMEFAKRDARSFYRAIFEAAKSRINDNEDMDKDEKAEAIAKEQAKLDKHYAKIDAGTDPKFREFRQKDYGGLTSLFSEYDSIAAYNANQETRERYEERVLAARHPKYDSIEEIEAAAEKEVKEWENRFGWYARKLWKNINAATKETLKQQYEANMLSKEQYEYVRDMFKFYVPMRGFAENTAEDMYSYYMSDQTSTFESALKSAGGRTTVADNPFSYIGHIYSSSNAANAKNEAKLTLYYFLNNRPDNDIATISEVWYERAGEEDGKAVFKPVYPEMTDDMTGPEAKAAYQRWEKEMKEKASRGDAFRRRKKLKLDSVIHITDQQAKSHVIKLKVGGEDKMIIINGNPRAAQAINGELNFDSKQNEFTKGLSSSLRLLSSLNTTYNPEFVISNLQRDVLMSIMSASVEGSGREFIKNLTKATKVVSMNKAYNKGTLGNSMLERDYREFRENGGMTGYSTVRSLEAFDREIDNYLGEDKDIFDKILDGIHGTFEKVSEFSESIEQISRFAAYLTAKENGKSVVDSISSAKEVTVNFNRKGSAKILGVKEAEALLLKGRDMKELDRIERTAIKAESILAAAFSCIAWYGRSHIMFFNAAVQGINTLVNLYKKNGRKTAEWAGAYMMLGAMGAVLHALMDDDDDYFDMPDYERRTNLLIGANGFYFKWAMPQEMRAFYGLGDIFVNHALGREPHKNIIWESLKSLMDISPVNPTEGFSQLAPSYLTPIIEVITNKNFQGARIYDDMRFLSEEERKRTPAYKKALRGTGKMYVDVSKLLNSIGNPFPEEDVRFRWLNINPAAVEHLVEGYSGGAGTMVEKIMQFASSVVGNEPLMLRNTPMLRRMAVINDERSRNAHTTDLYYFYKAEAEHTNKKLKSLQKKQDTESLQKLRDSGDIDVMRVFDSYKGIMKFYDDQLKETDDADRMRELMQEQDAYRKEMIKKISEIK